MFCLSTQSRRSGGRGAVAPNENIGGKHIVFFFFFFFWGGGEFRHLEKFTICNARIGLKSTVRHYKTIKFDIKNTSKHIQLFLLLPPPPPHPKNGSTPLFPHQLWVFYTSEPHIHYKWKKTSYEAGNL